MTTKEKPNIDEEKLKQLKNVKKKAISNGSKINKNG